ncbi:MAG: DUF1573 domain-containing protein [Bacteroidales bacterium]|jgi:hypothetical protein|nr:DUF1573 domain-containing protein [Bacteroidales bacterium]
MKKSVYFITVFAGLMICLSCNSQNRAGQATSVERDTEKQDTVPLTTVEYAETEHDFGKITEGDKASHRFEFTNTGNADLRVLKTNAYCGCTVAKYSKEPVPPGKKGFVEVVFDSRGRQGRQQKNVAITTNTKHPSAVLTIICEIMPKNKQ